ncbi:PucR family transcriptional regulator [Calidifontibacillus oryziterrae]|uniref:PucR family transcriptional regulator n=1 Tax=Calidifontibacillus oryziterrae TaxID=1191699 RepID=UPI0003111A94|nr:helix-turn-helix domain-containing protein [Calidifontibacillus oryziterrae]
MKQQLAKALTISDFHKVVEYISHTLKKPIILEDDGFNLLSYSSYYIKDFDQANQQTILSKKCPISILEKFIEEGIIDQLQSITGPFRVRKIEEIGLNQRVVVSTQHKQLILGYLWVQEIEKLLSEQELKFLEQVAIHIGKLLYRNNVAKREKDEKKGHFYRQLLSNGYKNEKELKQQAETLNIVLPPVVRVVVFTVAAEEDDLFDQLKETVQSYLNVTLCAVELIVDSRKVIVILGDSFKNSSLQVQANELVIRVIKSFETNYSIKIFAGIGDEYLISLLSSSYQEAIEVIKAAEFLGQQDHMAYEYQKLGVYRYLQVLADHNRDSQYVNPLLLQLQQKDQENQTELLKTVEAYLLNNCKAKQTAEYLFIHPNTLNYRIKQIIEHTGIDFSDFSMNCQLFIDLLLLKQQK